MANWGQIISKVRLLQGSRGTVTLGRKQILQLAKKAGAGENALQEIGEMLGKAKKPQVDIGYKVSDQGFTVAAAQFRDGKKVLGNGAISVTGLGSETPLFKMRMGIGEKGHYLTSRGWVDLAQDFNVDDVATNFTIKNGIWESKSHIGQSVGASGRANYKAIMDDLASFLRKHGEEVPAGLSYQTIIDTANGFANKALKELRKLVAGKEQVVKAVNETVEGVNVKPKSIDEIFDEIKSNKSKYFKNDINEGKAMDKDWMNSFKEMFRKNKPEDLS